MAAPKIVDDFIGFISKADVIALAVAVVFGVAFNSVITAIVADLITPLIGVAGNTNFNSISYTVNNSTFMVGAVVSAIINFIIIALVVFFLIVRPVQRFENARAAKKQTTPTTKVCPYCIQTIPKSAKRCMYCTSKIK